MENTMRIALIVAATQNGVIGKDNGMPWHLPEDLKYFKRVTMGKPVIMGRKTYESIGRPLPGRLNIVITRQLDWLPADKAGKESLVVATSLESALATAKDYAVSNSADEIMVIGGAQIYAACADRVDRVYLTEIAAQIEGDAYFSLELVRGWAELSRQHFGACEKNPHEYSFVVFERVPE
jgi:dihydrofolate reductase